MNIILLLSFLKRGRLVPDKNESATPTSNLHNQIKAQFDHKSYTLRRKTIFFAYLRIRSSLFKERPLLQNNLNCKKNSFPTEFFNNDRRIIITNLFIFLSELCNYLICNTCYTCLMDISDLLFFHVYIQLTLRKMYDFFETDFNLQSAKG